MRFSESVSAHRHDGVLVVTIDNPPVNALSAHVRSGLVAALDHAAGAADIVGLVIVGAGRTFIGGADIKEFGKPAVEPLLPEVIARIERFAKPVVCAINGACHAPSDPRRAQLPPPSASSTASAWCVAGPLGVSKLSCQPASNRCSGPLQRCR